MIVTRRVPFHRQTPLFYLGDTRRRRQGQEGGRELRDGGLLQGLDRGCEIDEAFCLYRQGREALCVARDLVAIVVLSGDTEACHRAPPWVAACLTGDKSTLACIFMLCPVPSPKNLQEEFFS